MRHKKISGRYPFSAIGGFLGYGGLAAYLPNSTRQARFFWIDTLRKDEKRRTDETKIQHPFILTFLILMPILAVCPGPIIYSSVQYHRSHRFGDRSRPGGGF